MSRIVICALLLVCGRISLAQDQAPPPVDTPDFWKDTLVNTVDALDGQYRNVVNKVRPSGKAFRRSLGQSGVSRTTISKLKTALDANVGVARAHARTFSERGMKLAGLAFDHGPELLGNASVGDFDEVAVVVGNALPEELATAAGAYVGTGAGVAVLAILGVGGVTVGGPVTVAAIAGGALGGWLGAVSAETIYSAYVSESVKDVVRSILPAGEDPDRFERAVESRKELLAEEAKKTGNRDAERTFYTRLAEIRREQEVRQKQELAEQSETFLSAPGADNPDRWKKLEARAKQLAKETAEHPKATQAADPDTVPVIPEVAVIDVALIGPPGVRANASFRWSFYIRSGKVSGQMVPLTSPVQDNEYNTVSAGEWKARMDGTIRDNVIQGKILNEPTKFVQEGKDPNDPWVRELTYSVSPTDVTVTLLPDGTLKFSTQGGTLTIDSVDTAGKDKGKTFQVAPRPNDAQTMTGVWQYRDAPAKVNESPTVPD